MNYKTVTYWIVFGVMVFSAIFWAIIFQRFDAKNKADRERRKELAELEDRRQATIMATEQRRAEKIREIEKRLRVLESSMNRIRTKEETPAVAPKPSSDSQSDDLAVNLESMSDREYQAWVMEHANVSDRKILAEHFQRENEFKASLSRTQKKAFDNEVERKYSDALELVQRKAQCKNILTWEGNLEQSCFGKKKF